MYRIILAGFGAIFLLVSAASAQTMTDKQKCEQGIEDVRASMAAGDTPDPGEKAKVQVEELLTVSASLCERGNFPDASRLIALARGMVASE